MNQVITKKYFGGEYLYYPHMEALLEKVMNNPDKEISLPENFTSYTHQSSQILDKILYKIVVVVRSIWVNIRYFFDDHYRKQFILAVNRIAEVSLKKKEPQKKAGKKNSKKKKKVSAKSLPILKKVSICENMFNDIQNMTGSWKVKVLWEALLGNLSSLNDHIESWECSKDGKYNLRFKEPIHFWIDTKKRKGGCVFIFSKLLSGSLANNTMQFNEGFNAYCYYGKFLMSYVSPQICELSYCDHKEKVFVTGKYLYQKSQDPSKFDEIREEWSDKVTVIQNGDQSYIKFLEEKVKKL